MAKNEAKGKAAKADTKPAKTEEFKYGVADLAAEMGIEPASVRVQLRNKNVQKLNGNAYGWKTKDELKQVAEKLRTEKPEPKGKPKVKAAGTEKPAKAVAKKKAA